jgi:hypothetical protein
MVRGNTLVMFRADHIDYIEYAYHNARVEFQMFLAFMCIQMCCLYVVCIDEVIIPSSDRWLRVELWDPGSVYKYALSRIQLVLWYSGYVYACIVLQEDEASPCSSRTPSSRSSPPWSSFLLLDDRRVMSSSHFFRLRDLSHMDGCLTIYSNPQRVDSETRNVKVLKK